MDIECKVFVYKRTYCAKGDLIIGNNQFEIIYRPESLKTSHNHKNEAGNDNPKTRDNPTTSPSLSASSSGFLSYLSQFSPMLAPYDNDTLHRIVIDWDTISGLQRINKDIEYDMKNKDKKQSKVKLREQLIIESTSYPTLYTMEYDDLLEKYVTKSTQQLKTHYIGLEYDLSHSHQVLLSNNYIKYQTLKQDRSQYNIQDIDECNIDFDDENITKSSLLDKYPQYSLLINHHLPAWIWIPLLNHTLRVFIERVILLGNIGLFIWTIYQMTKYTSIIKTFYEHIFYPLYNYISQPILKKIYYFLNLMHFHIVVQLCGNIFSVFYNYIPVDKLYSFISFIDKFVLQKINQHFIQQIIGLFTIIYRCLAFIGNLFIPLFNLIISLFKGCFNIINWGWFIPNINFDCSLCTKLSAMCDGRCLNAMKLLFKCIRRCCRLCQRSQTLTDSSTKILKAGVGAMNNAEGIGSTIDSNTAYSICNGIRYIWNYCRQIIDVFWLGIGKPIKHSYDFFKYIRSEVGTVVAICIRKCCRKGRDRAIEALKSTRNKNKKKENKDNLDNLSNDDTKNDHAVIQHNARFYDGDNRANDKNNANDKHGAMELRHRAKASNNAKASHGRSGSILFVGQRENYNEDDSDQKFSAVAGFEYFKDKDRDKRH